MSREGSVGDLLLQERAVRDQRYHADVRDTGNQALNMIFTCEEHQMWRKMRFSCTGVNTTVLE